MFDKTKLKNAYTKLYSKMKQFPNDLNNKGFCKYLDKLASLEKKMLHTGLFTNKCLCQAVTAS